jgi:hypothetical protein
MQARILRLDILPFLGALAALGAVALLCDGLLHLLQLGWIGRYLGIPGTLLILVSLGYSLRKRGLIHHGNPSTLLRERLAWVGSLLVLVHAGIHFNALLAWLAIGAMLINVISGLTGKYLLKRARQRLAEAREQLRADGIASDSADEQLHGESLTLDLVKQWRIAHFPIAFAFGALALAHMLSIFVFWSWR